MADTLTPEQRHVVMSHIRSKDTRPEMLVRRFLHRNGVRYSLHAKHFPGQPDLLLRRYRTAIFVNGCFWHGHENCPVFRLPKSNTGFWTTKIERNKARDAAQHQLLQAHGWHVIVVWECQLRKVADRERTLQGLLRTLNLIELRNKHVRLTYRADEEEHLHAAEDDGFGYGKEKAT